MALDFNSASEVRAWAESLKEQIQTKPGGDRAAEGGNDLPATLQQDLLEALDLLLEQAGSDHVGPLEPSSLEDRVAEVIDDSLSRWQAGISTGLEQSVAKELERQLKLADRLREGVEEQGNRVADYQKELELQLAEVLKRQTKLARQRKSIAQGLRAQKAQMLLELERSRARLQEKLSAEVHERLQQEYSEQIELLEHRFRDQQQQTQSLEEQLADTRQEFEELSAEYRQIKEAARASDAGWQELLTQSNQRLDRLQEELQQSREGGAGQVEDDAAIAEMRENLERAQNELQRLSVASEQLDASERELAELRQKCRELESGLQAQESNQDQSAALQEEVDRLRDELESAQQQCSETSQAGSEDHELRQALAEAEQAIEDLRHQNSDLAAQVAKQQVVGSGTKPHVQFDQESLSWEERKKLILQQLEADSEDDQANPQEAERTRVEVERVVATTEMEIARRDREIEELRSIVEQQADTKQGVAIGAAAIAQVFESDELIQQERDKLKEIQKEWEEKLRQAEIDLSMERAKLARERSQLEAELKAIPKNVSQDQDEAEKGGARTRKWLEHLGLREEGGDAK